MTASVTVTTGTQITAVHHNDLRADVVDTTNGHKHSGSDSAAIPLANLGITAYCDKLGADVTLTNTSQWYSVLTRSLAAGTWLVMAQVSFNAAQSTARLSNGSTTYYAHGSNHAGSVSSGTIVLATVVTLASTTTMTLSGIVTVTGSGRKVLAQTNDSNDSSNDATQLVCIRIA